MREDLLLFRTALVERSAYKEMFLVGTPPSLAEPTKGAGLEITALIDEILRTGEGEADQTSSARKAEHAA